MLTAGAGKSCGGPKLGVLHYHDAPSHALCPLFMNIFICHTPFLFSKDIFVHHILLIATKWNFYFRFYGFLSFRQPHSVLSRLLTMVLSSSMKTGRRKWVRRPGNHQLDFKINSTTGQHRARRRCQSHAQQQCSSQHRRRKTSHRDLLLNPQRILCQCHRYGRGRHDQFGAEQDSKSSGRWESLPNHSALHSFANWCGAVFSSISRSRQWRHRLDCISNIWGIVSILPLSFLHILAGGKSRW